MVPNAPVASSDSDVAWLFYAEQSTTPKNLSTDHKCLNEIMLQGHEFNF